MKGKQCNEYGLITLQVNSTDKLLKYAKTTPDGIKYIDFERVMYTSQIYLKEDSSSPDILKLIVTQRKKLLMANIMYLALTITMVIVILQFISSIK